MISYGFRDSQAIEHGDILLGQKVLRQPAGGPLQVLHFKASEGVFLGSL